MGGEGGWLGEKGEGGCWWEGEEGDLMEEEGGRGMCEWHDRSSRDKRHKFSANKDYIWSDVLIVIHYRSYFVLVKATYMLNPCPLLDEC